MIQKLPDGRDLAYAEYGDPQGTPVFFFHGTPGSRLFHPPDEVTKRLGVHLICVDRPGYGASTFQPNRRLLDWSKDVASLADALNIDTFIVAGHSGGGPHALACAYALPDRVKAAGTISGAGPAEAPGAAQGLILMNWLGFTLMRYVPWPLAYPMVRWFFRRQAADPAKAIDLDQESRPLADNKVFELPDIREICIQSDVEAYRPGLLGLAWDVRLITGPWGFTLEKIEVPVHIWHGTADNTTSLTMARYMAGKIPNSKLTIYDGEAHMLLIPHWEEILKTLIGMSNRA
jgi:pimeloyl-ACP methyl ester carboxylesterase